MSICPLCLGPGEEGDGVRGGGGGGSNKLCLLTFLNIVLQNLPYHNITYIPYNACVCVHACVCVFTALLPSTIKGKNISCKQTGSHVSSKVVCLVKYGVFIPFN